MRAINKDNIILFNKYSLSKVKQKIARLRHENWWKQYGEGSFKTHKKWRNTKYPIRTRCTRQVIIDGTTNKKIKELRIDGIRSTIISWNIYRWEAYRSRCKGINWDLKINFTPTIFNKKKNKKEGYHFHIDMIPLIKRIFIRKWILSFSNIFLRDGKFIKYTKYILFVMKKLSIKYKLANLFCNIEHRLIACYETFIKRIAGRNLRVPIRLCKHKRVNHISRLIFSNLTLRNENNFSDKLYKEIVDIHYRKGLSVSKKLSNFNQLKDILTNLRYKNEKKINLIKTLKYLSFGLRAGSGVNNLGRKTVKTKSSGKRKRRYRIIDFYRNYEESFLVIKVEYDPNRSANIALVCFRNGLLCYIIAVSTFKEGTFVNNESFTEGISRPLCFFNYGDYVSNIELNYNYGAKIARSAGTYGIVLQKLNNNQIVVKLPSGEQKILYYKNRCVLGVVSNIDHKLNKGFKKAGSSFLKGKKPIVRGVSKNSVDHPHGGGRGRSSKLVLPSNFTGRVLKGVPKKKKEIKKKYLYKHKEKK